MNNLIFGRGNAKLDALEKLTGKPVYTFSLLSGWSCPFAEDCLSKVIIQDGKRKVKDGPKTEFRCFSASQEALFTPVYNSRKNNFDLLRSCENTEEMVELIAQGMEKHESDAIYRWHVGGDFFNEKYFLAFISTARNIRGAIFYAYTKSLPYWVKNRPLVRKTKNVLLTASYGGRYDNLIGRHKLRYAKVVYSKAEAKRLGLPIDHDDRHAALPKYKDQDFCLLLHGTQPKGTTASTALKKLKGVGSYSR